MDILSYYTIKPLKLEDIERCASEAGYKTGFQHDPDVPDMRLYIVPSVESPLYWRWEPSNTDWDEVDFEEHRILSLKRKDIQSHFAIWYPMMYM